jgi:hypothetical protein
MRAPPESFSPITGTPVFSARSMILQIFFACASPSEPPNTVKSCENTNTGRPSMKPRARHDAVAEELLVAHAEVLGAMDDEAVDLAETALVEQQRDALARRELALLVLLRDAVGAAAEFGLGVLALQEFDRVVRWIGHRWPALDG